MPYAAAQVWSAGSGNAGCSLTLYLERGCVPQSGASRSSFAKLACGNTPDAAELFNVLRLVLCTQPRSNLLAFRDSVRKRLGVLASCRRDAGAPKAKPAEA
jgi:hypothetical protein